MSAMYPYCFLFFAAFPSFHWMICKRAGASKRRRAMNCFLNEVRGYADLDGGRREEYSFAMWQPRIQNIEYRICEDMEGECHGSPIGRLHSYLYFFWHNQLFAYHDNLPTCWQVSWHADAAIEYASLRLRVRTLFPVCLWSTRCWVWDANCTAEKNSRSFAQWRGAKNTPKCALVPNQDDGALSKCGENLKSEWKEQKS